MERLTAKTGEVCFAKWFDWDELLCQNNINIFKAVVERLFLWNPRHSGGTSQHLKCEELGIDSDSTVIFEDERNIEE